MDFSQIKNVLGGVLEAVSEKGKGYLETVSEKNAGAKSNNCCSM